MRSSRRLAQLWLDALATELGASAGTIATNIDDLNCYFASLDENALDLDAVGLGQIRDYIADLDRRLCWKSRKRPWRRGCPVLTGSPLMFCGTRLQPTCTQEAPIHACFRSCSAMPVSRPLRSTPIPIPPAFSRWSETCTRSTSSRMIDSSSPTEGNTAASRLCLEAVDLARYR